LLDQAEKQASEMADQLSAAIRQSNKISLDDLAKQYHLTVAKRGLSVRRPPVGAREFAGSQECDVLLRIGELNRPFEPIAAMSFLSVKSIQPAHQGSLEESVTVSSPISSAKSPRKWQRTKRKN